MAEPAKGGGGLPQPGLPSLAARSGVLALLGKAMVTAEAGVLPRTLRQALPRHQAQRRPHSESHSHSARGPV